MTTLSVGHAVADLSQGAVPALLPFLIDQRGYSYAAASVLVLASTLSSSVIQPLFGLWSDRASLALLVPIGVLLSGLGIGLVGVAPSYELTFLAVLVSGLGVAAFHPEGSRHASRVAGARRATGMSRFAVGGNVGFALGPVITTPLVLLFGLPGTLLLVVPGLLAGAVLLRETPRMKRQTAAATALAAEANADPESSEWGPFARLGGVIALRTFFYFGLSTFVPLYFIAELGASEAVGNAALSALLSAGVAGTLIGGPLADRYGRRKFLMTTTAVSAPLLLLFLASGRGPAMIFVALIGACTVASFSITVVMSQEYLPARVGLASGVSLGLAIGLGGVGASATGLIADAYGVRTAIEVLAVLPVLGVGLILTLPRHTRHERRERAL